MQKNIGGHLIDFKKYYKILKMEKVNFYNGRCLNDLVLYGLEILNCFKDCKKILDLGCGDGQWSEYLKNKGFEVISCDIDNSLYPNAIISDAHHLIFKEKEFDAIFCNGVFEHLLSPFIALCEMNKVLKQDGIVYLNMPHEKNTALFELPQHISIFNYEAMKSLIKKTNFKIEACVDKNDIVSGAHKIYILQKTGDIIE